MKTSIVILTYNKLEYTKLCIESIRSYTTSGAYELIIVDNGSTDGTREWLAEQADIITILNDDNVGFPAGCNQGMRIASGDAVMLLNNDIVVTEHWLDYLLQALYSGEDIGAVGPVTNNSSYYQAIPVNYSTLDEMFPFAAQYNCDDSSKWEQRLKLVGFCMLMKREVVEKIGLLDERFSPGNFEDDDYSLRMMQAGYKLLLCKNVFIHHFGSVSFGEQRQRYAELLRQNSVKFEEKWGFNSSYSTFIRYDILSLLNTEDLEAPLRVLEVGCACGGTLLQIKNQYRNAELYGIELNEHSAAIASLFADVKAMDVEKALDYPEEFFDYIILADVLEHLYDPWNVLKNIKRHLKKDGKILSSIPNVMHYTVLKGVINGHWTYTDSGLLDRTHVRFFTLNEIDKMFKGAGYEGREYSANVMAPSGEDATWVEAIQALSTANNAEQFSVYQYLVRAKVSNERKEITPLVRGLDTEDKHENVAKIIALIKRDEAHADDIIQAVQEVSHNKQDVLNFLSVELYKNDIIEPVLLLLEASWNIDNTHIDTIFNLGYILNDIGKQDVALKYLQLIEDRDEEAAALVKQILSSK